MDLLIIFLAAILVLNCAVLALLVLIQLPKKDAGAGVAFGGGATDALFGAGTGNALTKATKYAGTLFIGISVVLSLLYSNRATQTERRLEQEIQRQAAPSGATPLPTNQVLPPLTTPATTNPVGTAPVQTTNPAETPAPVAPAPEQPAQSQAPAATPQPQP